MKISKDRLLTLMREEASRIQEERQLDELLYEQDTASGQDQVQRFETLRKYFSLRAAAGGLEKGSSERIENIRDRMQLVVDFEKELKEMIEELNFMMDFAKRRGGDYGVDLSGDRRDAEAAERFGIDAPTAAQAGEEGAAAAAAAAAAGEGQSEAQALLDASGLSGEQIFAMVGGKSPVTGRDLEFGTNDLTRVTTGNKYAKLFSLQYFLGKYPVDPSFRDKVLEYVNQKPEEAIGILLEAPELGFMATGTIYQGYISNVIIPSFLNRRQFEELMQVKRMRGSSKGGGGSTEYVDIMRESPSFKDVADENSNKLIDILSSPAAGLQNINIKGARGNTNQLIAQFYNEVMKSEEISQESKTKFTNKLMGSNNPVKNIIASEGGQPAMDFKVFDLMETWDPVSIAYKYIGPGAKLEAQALIEAQLDWRDRSQREDAGPEPSFGTIEEWGDAYGVGPNDNVYNYPAAKLFQTAFAGASDDIKQSFLEAADRLVQEKNEDPLTTRVEGNLAKYEADRLLGHILELVDLQPPPEQESKEAQIAVVGELIKDGTININDVDYSKQKEPAAQQVSEHKRFMMTVERLDELIKEELINHRKYKKAIGIK
jgi:hypothetical protein